jgi:NitT/TauT family transport system ATP-binding protein|tara:strand:+ start:183 stop:1010 length:828 start_codon:yes stop_codon:yes gene_type:complete
MSAKEGHVQIINSTKIYDPEGVNVHAVDNCSFDINAGEFMAIVGPSGCGKTTLLNMIAGFDTITEGEIYLDGDLIASPDKKLSPGPDRVVVFQAGALFDWQTVLGNIIFGPMTTGLMTKSEATEKALELIGMAGLKGYENEYPIRISSGMKRRVEILRALINEPKTLLLDEPYRALDAITKSVMHKFLLDVFDRVQKTVMFITHDLDESIYLSDRVGIMTTRPGKFKKWVTVNLPRPRDFKIKKSPEFLELKKETIEAVHEEARKSFERGEREGA